MENNTRAAQTFNPYLPSYEYIPDGEPHVFGGRLYVFGSHDRFNGAQFCLNDYVLWSAPTDDLSDWRFEGVIYRKTQDPYAKDNSIMQAPDVLQGVDGRYYLYYSLGLTPFMSIAVSDKPEGPYTYYGTVQHPDGTPIGLKEHDLFQFDPGLLKDNDGKVYLYSGFGPAAEGDFLKAACEKYLMDGAYVMELAGDMRTVITGPKLMIPKESRAAGTSFEGHGFYEASSMRKIDGRYYFIYSSVNQHELCYAVSDHPDRDFVYGGTLVSIGDIGLGGRTAPDNYLGNTHGSIVQINGQWYVFYHRQTNCHQYSRQGCAEKICFENGRFLQAELTSCGLNDGPLSGRGEYPAYIACNLCGSNGAMAYGLAGTPEAKTHPYFTQSGEDREDTPDQYIANMQEGASACFKYFDMDGCDGISMLIGGAGDGYFEVEFGDKVSVRLSVSKEDVNKREWFSCSPEDTLNIHDSCCAIRFTWHGSGSIDFHQFRLE